MGKKPKFLGGNGKGDGTGQRATLISTGSTKDLYNIEYRLQKPDEFDRLLYQVRRPHLEERGAPRCKLHSAERTPTGGGGSPSRTLCNLPSGGL